MALDKRLWRRVRIESFTAIRKDFPVTKLQDMADRGNPTAVSGDQLTVEKVMYR